MASAAHQQAQDGWVSLHTPPEELWLANTLVTGQSFRWRRTDDSSSPHDTYTGVIGQRLVQMRQLPADVQYRVLARSPSEPDPSADAAALQDYLNLSTSLQQLSRHWAGRDPRYAAISPALPGCRMLRQDPVECLFQFICSSNNHISRIHGMVERLCSTYGSPLLPSSTCSSFVGEDSAAGSLEEERGVLAQQKQEQQQQQQPQQGSAELCFSSPGTPAAAAAWPGQAALLLPQGQQQQQQQQHEQPASPPLPFAAAATVDSYHQQPSLLQPPQQQGLGDGLSSFFAFPTLEQLSAATEDALRADGFGYRAKYIVGSVQALLEKPEGGRAWLLALRDKPYVEAHEALCSLPGVGPKVAACICLFSLDKHDAIPVDTHVWDLATRYYAPHLAKKSLTPKLHAEVQQAFVDRFGPHAGWAHNCLFIGELASHRHLLPTGVRATAAAAAAAAAATAAAASGGKKKKKRKSQEVAAEEAAAAVQAVAVAAGPTPQASAEEWQAAASHTPDQGQWEGASGARGEAAAAAAAATVPRRRRRAAKTQQLEAAAAVVLHTSGRSTSEAT